MKAAKVVALLAVAALCSSGAAFLFQLRETTAMLSKLLHDEADLTRVHIVGIASTALHLTQAEIAETRRALEHQISAARQDALVDRKSVV